MITKDKLEKRIEKLVNERKHWDDCFKNLKEPKFDQAGYGVVTRMQENYNAKIQEIKSLIFIYFDGKE